jgi:hypothetical protein
MPINIKGKEYVTVAERVKEIHNTEKNFDIVTEVLSHDPVVVKATIRCAKGTFTGISYANVNKVLEKQSPYEVAETSAVGRALGFAGYGLVDDIATADEMKKAGVSPSPENKEIDFGDTPQFPTKSKILRDTKGHTVCASCGMVVSEKIEKYSLDKFGKILCFNCQKKETNE